MAYTIYCLIDPRNDELYYIGITYRKLNIRLSSHIGHANSDRHMRGYDNGFICKRHEIVYQLKEIGLKPIIKALFVVDAENAEDCEWLLYKHYKSLGFNLIQSEYRFNYQSRMKAMKTWKK